MKCNWNNINCKFTDYQELFRQLDIKVKQGNKNDSKCFLLEKYQDIYFKNWYYKNK